MTANSQLGLLRYVEQPESRDQGSGQHPSAPTAERHAVAWLDWLLRHRDQSPRLIKTGGYVAAFVVGVLVAALGSSCNPLRTPTGSRRVASRG